MSTELRKSRIRLALVGAAVAVALATSSPQAAQWDFRPSFVFSAFSDGNPNVVGEDADSDEVTRSQLNLVVEATSPTTRWNFAYRPYHEAFSNKNIDDNTGHIVTSSLRHDVSRGADLYLDLYATRTERQLVRYETVDQPDTLVPRTTIDRARLDLGGEVDVGSRSYISWQAGGDVASYEDLPGLDYNDSDAAGAGLGWGRRLSRKARMGVQYGFRHISYEDTESTDLHTVGLTADYRFSELLDLRARVGFQRVEVGVDDDTTTSFDVRVNRLVARGQSVQAGARQVVTAGTGTTGATEDRGVYGSWRYRGSRRWEGDVLLRYWDRETVRPGSVSDTGSEGFQTYESVDWTPGRYIAVGVWHSFTDQSDKFGSDPFLEADYHSGGVNLRWDIRGR